MNYHSQPATEALEHSARIRCNDRAMPPRATAPKLSCSSLDFDVTALFHTAVSMQQQDPIQFPVIEWSSDDDDDDDDDDEDQDQDQDMTSPEAASSIIPSPDEAEKERLGSNCKLTTKRGLSKRPHQEYSEGAHRMVRSKALHSELSLLSSSFSTSRSSSAKRHGVVAELA
jgi:hypothetical protein